MNISTYLPRSKDEKLLENYVCHVNEVNDAGYESHYDVPNDACAAPSEIIVTLGGTREGTETSPAENMQNKFGPASSHGVNVRPRKQLAEFCRSQV